MVKIELNVEQLKKAIEQLPERQRLQLTQDLARDNGKNLWREILRDIDKRVKRFPVSQEEIDQEIKACRKRKHAQSRR